MTGSRCLLLALCAAVSGNAYARKSTPEYLVDPAAEHPDHSADTFVCGLGTSPDSLDDASETARGSVSRQIASQIEGTTERVSEVARSMEGHLSASRSLDTTITEQYAFAYAELIATIETRQPTRKDPTYRVLACLDRSEAAARILQENQPTLNGFDQAVGLATAAAEDGDLAAFALAYGQAGPLGGTLREVRALLGVVSPDDLPAIDSRLDALAALDDEAAALRASARMSLHVTGAEGPNLRQLEGALQQALGILGVATTTSTTGCASGSDATHSLNASSVATCKRGYVALSCQIQLSLQVTACGTGQLHGGIIEDAAFRGMDNQFKEEPALEAAWETLQPAPMVPHLTDLLQGLIPLP